MFRLFFKTWPTTVRVAAATAATASAATVTTFALSEEEKPAVFNVEHYGTISYCVRIKAPFPPSSTHVLNPF